MALVFHFGIRQKKLSDLLIEKDNQPNDRYTRYNRYDTRVCAS